jgi:hypothetical protein
MHKAIRILLTWSILLSLALAAEKLALFYSGSVQGETEPCG